MTDVVCERRGKFFGGCRFEGRYNFGAPTVTKASGGAVSTVPEILEASKPRTYVHDVCTTCGKVVSRTALSESRP